MRGLLAERGLADLSFAVVASYRADPSLNGLSMKQVAAKLKGAESADAQFEAAREMMLTGGASMVYHFMSDEDIDRIMKHPQVGIASDSSVLTMGEGVPHPRGYGNNARVLGEYVRARKVISIEEAVRKMTSLPADQFRFADRGRIAQGNFADIVVFDRDTVGDNGVEPLREMSFEIRWATPWEAAYSQRTTYWTFRLTGLYGGTQVEIFHHGFELSGADAGEDLEGYEEGWDVKHLKALRAIVEQ